MKRTRYEPTTVGESIDWSYANLAMATAALKGGAASFSTPHYMIRARLFKGLRTQAMHMGSLVEDDRLKLVLPQACCYCGIRDNLSLDHLFPKSRGGPESSDNIVWSCRSCNSSKGHRDLIPWLAERRKFPALYLLRRYLKLAAAECEERRIQEVPLPEALGLDLPFDLQAIPHRYPRPPDLVLWVAPL